MTRLSLTANLQKCLNEGLAILDEAYTEEEYAIAVKKGNKELVDGINAAIAKLKESGELQKIVDKYITAD